MNRYRVSVADKATGQVSHTVVEATSEDGARERATEQGQGKWLVGEVKFEAVVESRRRRRGARGPMGGRRARPISIAAAVALAIIAIVVALAIVAQLL